MRGTVPFFLVLAAGVCVSASGEDGQKPKAPVLQMNICPPLVFMIKDADVNGDGKVTEADEAILEEGLVNEKSEARAFRKRFFKKLKVSWPEYPWDRRLWPKSEGEMGREHIMRRVVSSCSLAPATAVAVVLVRWTGSTGLGDDGATSCINLDKEALRKLRSGQAAFVRHPQVGTWIFRNIEAPRYFGIDPKKAA